MSKWEVGLWKMGFVCGQKIFVMFRILAGVPGVPGAKRCSSANFQPHRTWLRFIVTELEAASDMPLNLSSLVRDAKVPNVTGHETNSLFWTSFVL
jgi:hypothetical protein